MSVWYCIPSALPAAEAQPIVKLWRDRGYKVALCRDEAQGIACDHLESILPYPGYAIAVNSLVHQVMAMYPDAEWFVTGGDDIHPDPNHTADEIALECSTHFGSLHAGPDAAPGVDLSVKSITAALAGYAQRTFGVMQPTGDRWGDRQGAYADRVCGSPWMGREFCRRIYGGKGPIWPEFQHMFEDEHLQAVTVKLGILWQRPDLIHYHEHWVRKANDTGGFSSREDFERRQPAHYKKWSNRKHWDEAKAIFDRLKAAGFKEAEDLLP